jgi:hypothetical protein
MEGLLTPPERCPGSAPFLLTYPYPTHGGAGAVSRGLQGRQGRAQIPTTLHGGYCSTGKGVNCTRAHAREHRRKDEAALRLETSCFSYSTACTHDRT